MGLIPYIKTGTDTSAELMNDLYSGLDEAVNLVTHNKSMFFLNGTNYWPSEETPEKDFFYYSSGAGQAYDGGSTSDLMGPSEFPVSTFGQDVNGAIKLSNRQFWFTSGAKSGDCDPNHADADGHCVGLEWKTPRRIDSNTDIGWSWKLYNRHYAFFMAVAGIGTHEPDDFYPPPVYKHEYHERMIDDLTIFQYNTGKKAVVVIEQGTKTSDFGRFRNFWINPYTSAEERQRTPYMTDLNWSLGQEFDNSLQVHKITGLKNWAEFGQFQPIQAGTSSTSSGQTDHHPGSGTGVGGGGLARGGSSSSDFPDAYTIPKSEKLLWSGLIRSAEKPERAKFIQEKENFITKKDREEFHNSCDPHHQIHFCPHTSKEELKNFEHERNEQNINRGGLRGQCQEPYQCWMNGSKKWFWTELKDPSKYMKMSSRVFYMITLM